MTAADGLRDLFAQYPFRGKDVVWLVDELLGVAQHFGSLILQSRPDETGLRGLSYQSPGGPEAHLSGFRIGMLRAMLARLAVLCSQETGTDFLPYGGRYSLRRSSRIGPVRLDIEFTNTAGPQRLQITRVPIDISVRPPPATAPRPAPPRPNPRPGEAPLTPGPSRSG